MGDYIFERQLRDIQINLLLNLIFLCVYQPDAVIVTLFSTPENGIILLDQFAEEENYTGKCGENAQFVTNLQQTKFYQCHSNKQGRR